MLLEPLGNHLLTFCVYLAPRRGIEDLFLDGSVDAKISNDLVSDFFLLSICSRVFKTLECLFNGTVIFFEQLNSIHDWHLLVSVGRANQCPGRINLQRTPRADAMRKSLAQESLSLRQKRVQIEGLRQNR